MSTVNTKDFDEHNLKELRVALPKMKLVEPQNQPSTSSSQVQEDINATTGELAEKKLLESDDSNSKSPKKNKNVVPGGDLKIKIRKSKIKLNPAEDKEKEKQKAAKSSGEDAKKRSASREKKNKTEPDKSPSKTKEKASTSKDKAQEKKVTVTQKEKKTPKKAEDSKEFRDVKELLRDDPTLPPGWKRIIKGKHVGTELKPVVCIASPEGRKFYFKARLKDYLEKTKSELTIDDFYFGLYKRTEKEVAENKNTTTPDVKKAASKKTQKQKRSESVVKEHEWKKIRLDSGGGSKKAQSSKSGAAVEKQKGGESSDEGEYEASNKNLLLEDPDLPEGWVRQVLIKNDANGHNKIQVWIISPDGKKFQRKHLLQKYLQKTKSPLNIDQFYFGICLRRNAEGTPPADEPNKEPGKQPSKPKQSKKRAQKSKGAKKEQKEEDKTDEISESLKNTTISPTLSKSDGEEPMWEDPNLPTGWSRYIKVRSAGESAGRMEVFIVSPDGKRLRSKAALEQYIKQKELDLNVDDFDFTVFGKNSKRYSAGPAAASTPKQKSEKSPSKKRSSASHTPGSASRNVTASSDNTPTREATMINYVSALMLNCGLRDLRSERRLRIPKQEQEKVLKNYLDSLSPETIAEDDEKSEVPSNWVKKLALCRSDFGTLEDDAAETIASATKDFLVNLTQNALKESKDQSKLEYNDVAEVVDKTDSLAMLKTLIPKKITYKEYMKLNRPTKFTSFT